jgi:hypothetical protein
MQLKGLNHICRHATMSADKDDIRMESVMASCECPFVEAAVEAVKGSDANRQQRPRAGDRRTFVRKSRL